MPALSLASVYPSIGQTGAGCQIIFNVGRRRVRASCLGKGVGVHVVVSIEGKKHQ